MSTIRIKNGISYDLNGWKYISVKGNASERGYAYGYFVAKEFKEIQKMLNYIVYEDLGEKWPFFIDAGVKLLKDTIKDQFKEYYDEMEGIAKGITAGGTPTTTDEIIAWNNYFTLTEYWFPTRDGNTGVRKGEGGAPDRCSAFMATGKDYTEDGGIVVNHNNFTSSSNIIGRIKVDGIFSADQYDRIGVFYNDEVRGVANLQYDDSYKQYYVYLTIYSNAGKADDTEGSETENLTFKIWDASQGKVLESTIDNNLTIPYQLNDVMGNLVNPKLFENTSSIEQDIAFNEGWTWLSFNVNDDSFNNLNELTKNMSLATNDRIISIAPVKSETYTENFGWDGMISNTGGLSANNMYKIYLSNEQSLKIKGSIVNINNWSFPIVKDWNWLPFTLPSNVLLPRRGGVAFQIFDERF